MSAELVPKTKSKPSVINMSVKKLHRRLMATWLATGKGEQFGTWLLRAAFTAGHDRHQEALEYVHRNDHNGHSRVHMHTDTYNAMYVKKMWVPTLTTDALHNGLTTMLRHYCSITGEHMPFDAYVMMAVLDPKHVAHPMATEYFNRRDRHEVLGEHAAAIEYLKREDKS